MKFTLPTLSIISSIFLAINAQKHIDLMPNYLDNGSKNFAFVGIMGGSSHFNWVLSIGDELTKRGHEFTFISGDQDTRYAKPFANIKSASYGPSTSFETHQAAKLFEEAKKNPSEFFRLMFNLLYTNFERDYEFLKRYFVDNKIDVAICDQFADSCVEAAKILHLPFIVTGSIDVSKESSAPYLSKDIRKMCEPTSEFLPISTRFVETFIHPISTIFQFYPIMKNITDRKLTVGIPAKMGDPGSNMKYGLKLVNNLNGYTPARPVNALAEYIGPVLSTRYAPLTKELEEYFASHDKVAYVAFGEKATPNTALITLLLTALLDNMEHGRLDGFIWATGFASNEFPESLTTPSNITYNVKNMFKNEHPHIRLLKYAPQTATLIQPSTKLFISHGGLTSWYESMYAGTPMIMTPFFGDQFSNSYLVEQNHLGGLLDPEYSVDEAIALFRRVLDDKDGQIKENVFRFQAMTQIHSRRGVQRGADLAEEVAYTNIKGRLPHRESADKRMSYFKVHNIDLYAILVLLVSSSLTALTILLKQLYRVVTKSQSIKLKNL